MSKTVSSRIDNRIHKDLVERCNQLGCNINEFVGESVKFTLYNESNFDFDLDDEIDSELNEKESEPIITNKSRVFDCKDGFLYEDGVNLGKCLDFTLRNGQVYDKTGKFLGTIQHSLKPKIEIVE
jgi:hypothetical protein